jgi:ABC-type nitrate/sulfonate/bicarbonate transport system ATPase subunit
MQYLRGRAPVTALAGLDAEVPAGAITCIVGPSGCGKSTMLGLASGALRPTAGEVLVGGRPVVGPNPARAVIRQSGNLFDWLTALGNVALVLRNRGHSREQARARAAELLDHVGLGDVAPVRPSHLSGGMRQRLTLARAFAADATVWLMDEPFASVDWISRRELHEAVRKLQRAHGITVAMVTHDVSEAVNLADRVIVLTERPGRVRGVFDLPADQSVSEHAATVESVVHLLGRR